LGCSHFESIALSGAMLLASGTENDAITREGATHDIIWNLHTLFGEQQNRFRFRTRYAWSAVQRAEDIGRTRSACKIRHL
jgi:hypothetical protein